MQLAALREANSDAEPIKVFFQVSRRPLYTVNAEHYVSELIEICGGTNAFDDLNELAPSISVEAVIDRAPEVMLASTDAGDDAFADWERWPAMPALSQTAWASGTASSSFSPKAAALPSASSVTSITR